MRATRNAAAVGLRRRGAALAVLHAAAPPRRAVEPNRDCALARRIACSPLSGLVGGVWQAVRARDRAGRATAVPSPYTGLMRWHHYAGLAFGLFTFTWVLSGCLSMDPWDWHPATDATVEQAAAVAGGLSPSTHSRSSSCAPARRRSRRSAGQGARAAHSAASCSLRIVADAARRLGRRLERAAFESRLIAALHPERGAFSRFADDDVLAAARAAMPRALQDRRRLARAPRRLLLRPRRRRAAAGAARAIRRPAADLALPRSPKRQDRAQGGDDSRGGTAGCTTACTASTSRSCASAARCATRSSWCSAWAGSWSPRPRWPTGGAGCGGASPRR